MILKSIKSFSKEKNHFGNCRPEKDSHHPAPLLVLPGLCRVEKEQGIEGQQAQGTTKKQKRHKFLSKPPRIQKNKTNPRNCKRKKSIKKNICQAEERQSIITVAKEPGESRQGDVVGKEKEQQGGRPGETESKRQLQNLKQQSFLSLKF